MKGKYVGLGVIKKLIAIDKKYDHKKIDSKDLGEETFKKMVEKKLIVVEKKSEAKKDEGK